MSYLKSMCEMTRTDTVRNEIKRGRWLQRSLSERVEAAVLPLFRHIKRMGRKSYIERIYWVTEGNVNQRSDG